MNERRVGRLLGGKSLWSSAMSLLALICFNLCLSPIQDVGPGLRAGSLSLPISWSHEAWAQDRMAPAAEEHFREAPGFTPFVANLPMIHIDTLGGQLNAEKKVPVRLGLWPYHPLRPLSPESFIRGEINEDVMVLNPKVRYRGHISLKFPKKSFAVEFEEQEKLLGLGSGLHWVLHGPYYDRSLIRNALVYRLAGQLDPSWYVPRGHMVELFTNGEYMGVYLLVEKIEQGKGRLNIPPYNLNSPLQSPFLAKVDWDQEPEDIFTTQSGTEVTTVFPKISKLKKKVERGELEQAEVDHFFQTMKWRIDEFETKLRSSEFLTSPQLYRQLINVRSFIYFILIQELTRNVDGYTASIHFHTDKLGRITMGPLWDFDLTFGNTLTTSFRSYKGWQLGSILRMLPLPSGFIKWELFWFRQILKNPHFVQELVSVYRSLRQGDGPLSETRIMSVIDQQVQSLGPAAGRNFAKWPVLGRPSRHLWINPPPWAKTHEEEIEKLKSWVGQRLLWMDQNIHRIAEF